MLTRRTFLAAGTAFGIGGLAFGRSRARQLAAGAKIRVALIGCGVRMQQLIEPIMSERVVALVDPDPRMVVATRAKMAQVGGRAALEGVRDFFDYRALFAEMGGALDAVFIATPNHHHAPAALRAMRLGLHVFVEKPLASTVAEAQLMGRVARETGVVTQVGNFGHSTKAMRLCVDAIKGGLIGEVRDVWCYDDRLNSMMHRPPAAPPPKGMDWDLWVGPAEMRPYRRSYLGQRWYDIRGFGNGSLGNMGNHVLDAPFWALNLMGTPPASVTMEDMSYVCPESWPTRETITYEFPARPGMDPVTLHWMDGIKDDVPIDEDVQYHYAKREWMNFPPIVLELEKKFKMNLGNIGTLFMGEKGILWAGQFGNAYQFVPMSLKKTLPVPPKKFRRLAKGKSHVHEFFDAIREGRKANADFVDYGVPLVKTVLLGNVVALAARDGRPRVEWDGKAVTNNPAANAYCRTTYRKGWEIGNV